MYLEKKLCESIRDLYPEVGECEEGVVVRLHEEEERLSVSLNSRPVPVTGEVSMDDAKECLEDSNCTSVAVEVLKMIDGDETARDQER